MSSTVVAVRILDAKSPRQLEGGHMGGETMAALEEKLQRYEDELMRLRVENEQLRQSSQAFGELAERLSVALRTATRVNRRQSIAADSGERWRSVAKS
jgi:seryl-tRNA(Sec) selenium transferase